MAYRLAVSLTRWLLRIFFRRIEVTGLENVPVEGGGLVVSWHPNALVDGALILIHFPRPIVFGARHGLFRWPLLGATMRALGMVPLYRRQDFPGERDDARRAANTKSLDNLARAVAGGAFSALFPEGVSHDEPRPQELKTGAARLFYRAVELSADGAPRPVILPVGLHYDKKRVAGSSALVAIHPPLALSPELAEPLPKTASDEERREQCRKLTAAIENALIEAVHATESWRQHYVLHRARKLLRAERAHRAGASPPRPDMKERVLAFSRVWAGYNERLRSHPEEVAKLFQRVVEYDSDLEELGVHDHELDASPRLVSPWLAFILVLQAILVYLLLPPILILGYIANSPPALAVWGVSKAAAREHKDEASLKLVTGAVAFPLTWLAVALLVAWSKTELQTIYPRIPGAPWVTGVLAFALSALGAYVALNYQRLARQTLRALSVRLTRLRRKEALSRLRRERALLYDEFARLAEGLSLPGRISRDGRVVATKGSTRTT